MSEQNDYTSNSFSTNNAGYYAATALQIRLDTSLVVRQIEMYLKGERTVLVDIDGNGTPDSRTIWKGKPLVSDEGLQGIMQFIEIIFNPQVVQGNFQDYDQYANYLIRTRMDLADHLMKNLKNYGIGEKNFNGMISTIMRFIEAFMTRLINNEERKSYANTIKSVENLQTNPKRGFSFFS